MIDQVVSTFNAETYSPRINIEHLAGYSPDPRGHHPHGARLRRQRRSREPPGQLERAGHLQVKKPESLKALLLASVPGLQDKPENLSMFIDKGRVAARLTGSLSFEYRYTVNVVVQDFAGDVDALFVPLLAWVAEQQPDLLERHQQEPFSFESEILDGDLADISIDLELTERVKVARTHEGLVVTHLDEPSRLDGFAGVDGVKLWAAILDDVTAGTIAVLPKR